MGRHSRSKKVLQKKREQASGTSSKSVEEEGPSGSLMSMRAGLKSIAHGESNKEPSKMGNILSWVVLVLLAIAVIVFLMNR